MPTAPQARNWSFWHTFALVVIVAGIGLIAWYVRGANRVGGWIAIMALLLLFTLIAGHGVTGLWRGALIDERNKMSLSRLQMVMWTIVILGGFLMIGVSNIALGEVKPLDIAVPAEVWALLGISTTSLVGSPLILSNKKQNDPDDKERERTFTLMRSQGLDRTKVDYQGLVVVNEEPSAAGWGDLFKGEETGNAAQLDMGKIQMLFFTLVLVLAYGIGIGALLNGTAAIKAFPELDAGIVALLGISHAGYLANKAVPHSKPRSP
jgi:hypothetical protein